MSPQATALSGFLFADDTLWGLRALRQLGFEVLADVPSKQVWIDPKPVLENKIKTPGELDFFLGKAGTLARFFPAALLNFKKTFPCASINEFTLNADPQLQKRPITDLCDALKSLNADIQHGIQNRPIKIRPSNLKGSVQISGRKSGQFLSGLLFAAAGSKEKITVTRIDNLVQPDYIKMTLETLKQFNCFINHDENLTTFSIHQKEILYCSEYKIEPDASTACYFIALAFLHNFHLTVEGLGSNSIQPDLLFVDFLKKMGAHIEISETNVTVFKRNSNEIFGGFCADFSLCSDQSLTAAVVALFADSPIEITGVGHIRNHECDRISCLVSNFTSLGIHIEEKRDGFVLFPVEKEMNFCDNIWKTFHDHRFAMSGFLLASIHEKIQIENPLCVEKTAPDFFHLAEKLGFLLH